MQAEKEGGISSSSAVRGADGRHGGRALEEQ